MTPDQINRYIETAFPELVAQQRSAPDGWAFFLGAPQRGPRPNRIARALRHGPDSVTKLKLAVTCRMNGKDEEIDFHGNEEDLRRQLATEIALFRAHFQTEVE